MFKKLVVTFLILALSAAFAGTVASNVGSYRITLLQPSVVNGTVLKPGDYKLNVANDKVTIVSGKTTVDATVKVETVEQKYDSTAIRYVDQNGKVAISEIRLGGTKTKLIFN